MSTVFIEAEPVPEDVLPPLDVRVGRWYRLENDLPVKVRSLRTYQGQRQAEVGTEWPAVWVPVAWLRDAGELLSRLNTERLREGPAAHPTRRGGGMEGG